MSKWQGTYTGHILKISGSKSIKKCQNKRFFHLKMGILWPNKMHIKCKKSKNSYQSQPRPQRFFSLQKLGQNGEKESPGLCRSILQSDWLPRFYNLRRPLKTFSRVTRVKSKQNGEAKRKNIDLAFSKKRFEMKEHKFWHKSKKKTFKRCVWYLLMAISKYKLGYYFVQTNTKLFKKE